MDPVRGQETYAGNIKAVKIPRKDYVTLLRVSFLSSLFYYTIKAKNLKRRLVPTIFLYLCLKLFLFIYSRTFEMDQS